MNVTDYIPRDELIELIQDIKGQIDEDYRAFDEDEVPGIQLTVGTSLDDQGYGWQTGDNSYDGGVYGFHTWGVVGVYPDTDPEECADDILGQIADQV